MTETDYSPTDSPSVIENNENQKPALTNKEKLVEKLRLLGKLRPLNIAKPRNGEIILEVVEPKKEEVEIDDAATKWLMNKVDLKEAPPILITKSPKTTAKKRVISKQNALKKELQEKLKVRRKDEQEERYMVYNADNEIVDDEEEVEDEEFDDEGCDLSDAEEKTKNTEESKKPKIMVDENEDIIEENDSDIDDEEDPITDEEEEEEEEEDEERSKNPFVDDEASDDPDNDSDEEEEEKGKEKNVVPSRILFSDDDDDDKVEEEEEEIVPPSEPETPNSQKPNILPELNTTPENTSQIILPTCLTQRLETYDGQQAPIEPDPSQRSICLDTQADKDELMMLCSGSFGTQKSDQTLCSKFEKYDVMDYLSDSSPIPESQSQDLQKINSLEKLSLDTVNENETQKRIDAIYDAFNNAEDTMDGEISFTDSECEPTIRKRRIVVYSDDEEEIQQSQPKHPKILDFDDSDIDETLDVSNLPSISKPSNSLAMDFDDVFTTEDTSNNPGFTEEIQSEPEDEDLDDGKDLDNYGSENDDDEEDFVQPDKMLRKFVDDEASLSGDDVGEDLYDEENDDALNDYELDEADKEEYDAEEVRNGLVGHHLKHMMNEDERQLYRLQQKYFADGDLHGIGNMDRSFRYRMRKEITDEDWEKLVKINPVLAKAESDDENDEDILTKKKSFDFKKWKNEKTVENEKEDDLIDDFDSPLFSLGKQALNKPISRISTKSSSVARGSLLNNPSSLGVLMKETVTETRVNALFTAIKKH